MSYTASGGPVTETRSERYTRSIRSGDVKRPSIYGSFVSRSSSSFDIVEQLGAGGMGVVYRAVDRRLGRNVALKFLSVDEPLDAEARERFLREARAASMLDHPNIGTIYGIEEGHGGELCIVMAYYDGETVAQRVARGPIPSSEAVSIAIQAAAGLAAAHEHGIVHRDIKPSNILVTRPGVVKIVDFGVARFTAQDQTITQPMAVVGTTAYMSPEQARGKQADQRSDIWSLAAVLSEMLTGRRPFQGRDVLAQVYAVTNHEPDLAGITDPALLRVLRKGLSKDAANRYASMAELMADLQEFAPATTGPVPVPRRRRLAGRRWFAIAATTVFVMASAAALVPGVRGRVAALVGANASRQRPIVLTILPFTNSQDPATAALATGLAESLSSRVGGLERFSGALSVVPAAEVMTRNVQNSADARSYFGATAVVSGVLSREPAGGMALDMELSDSRGAEKTRFAAPGVRALEDRAALWLSNSLDIRADVGSEGPTTESTVAYEAWLRGIGHLQRWDRPGNIDGAIEAFGEAIRADAQFARAYSGMAEASRTRYRTDPDPANIQHALNYAQQALRLDSRSPEAHVVLGRIYQDTAQRDLAVIEFGRALELNPRNLAAVTGLARSYEDLGRLAEAEATYKRVVELKTYAWTPLNSFGSFYLRHRRPAEAEMAFREALKLTPDNATVQSNLGVSLLRQKRMPEAVTAFRRSLELGPSYAAYVNLGNIHYLQREFRLAADNYQKALQLNNRDYRVWGTHAQALRLGRAKPADISSAYRNAIRLAEESLRVNPAQPRALSLLAIYYACVRERPASIRAVEAALASGASDRSVLVDAAIAYELLGERRKAARWAERALQTGLRWEELRDDPDLQPLIQGGTLRPPDK